MDIKLLALGIILLLSTTPAYADWYGGGGHQGGQGWHGNNGWHGGGRGWNGGGVYVAPYGAPYYNYGPYYGEPTCYTYFPPIFTCVP